MRDAASAADGEVTVATDRPDPDQLQQWVVKEGVPPSQVGALLGRSRAAGYAWLRRYGITTGPPDDGATATIGQAQLVARWRDGMSSVEIGEELGIPAAAIRERL